MGGRSDADSRTGLTRRRALGVIGAGVVGAAAVRSVTAQTAAATVEEDGGGYRATNGGSTVYSGGDLASAVRSAIDSLSSGRTSKEAVLVTASGEISSRIDVPSYTTLDFQGTVSANGVIPLYADRVESIEIANYHLEGSPSMGMRLRRSSDVVIGSVTMNVDSGIGIRIDNAYNDGTPITTTNVTIDAVDITGTGSHAVETYGVDGIDIGTVQTQDTGGCGVLLNDTTNATVDTVDAVRPDHGGGYAGFRVANDGGPNIHVNQVIVQGGARGVFGVSNSGGFTVDYVDIEGTTANGILIQDCQDVAINSGYVRNCSGDAVRVDSRDSGSHQPAENVTIQHLRVVNEDGSQAYGIRETGPETANNAFLNNDLRNAGYTADLEVYADSTTVQGNVLTGEEPHADAGPDGYDGSTGSITDTETPATQPDVTPVQLNGIYRIENVNSGHALSVENGSTADAASVVQRTYDGAADQHWTVEHLGDGVHSIVNENSGAALDVLEAQLGDGADVIQYPYGGGENQQFLLGEDASGDLAIVAQHSNRVLDVFEAATADGANVVQWTDNGGANQRWTVMAVDGSGGQSIAVGENQAGDQDGDGVYMDLNGNGRLDNDDVVQYFEHMDSAGIQNNVAAFDYNGNGRIDFDDVVTLFESL